MKRVLVVGAGPVGLLLSLRLRQFGVDVDIIDKKTKAPHPFTKALTINSASLRLFHSLGIVDKFLAEGKIIRQAEIHFKRKRLVVVNKKYLHNIYNYYLSLPQCHVERILESCLNELGAQVRYQTELLQIKNYSSPAVILKCEKTKCLQHKSYDYVIGCDGARSTVRKELGLDFSLKDHGLNFVLTDLQLLPSEFPKCATYYVNENGFLGLFPMNDGSTRLVFQNNDKSFSQDKLSPPFIESLVNQYAAVRCKILRILNFSQANVKSAVTKMNQVGNVFLAGDAYHLFSPVGGQGMNTGLEDAFELAWRLAHVINAKGKEVLLNDYDRYRLYAIEKVMKNTNLNTELITRRLKNHEKLQYFSPKFHNRAYFRNKLAQEFSGYGSDYRQNTSTLLGMHMPYLPFNEVGSTYDFLVAKTYLLFSTHAGLEWCKNEIDERLLRFISIVATEVKVIKGLGLDKADYCLVSPSGYITVSGDKLSILQYFSNYYNLKA